MEPNQVPDIPPAQPVVPPQMTPMPVTPKKTTPKQRLIFAVSFAAFFVIFSLGFSAIRTHLQNKLPTGHWQTYAPSGEGFSVDLPCQNPTVQTTSGIKTVDCDLGKGDTYTILYVPIPPTYAGLTLEQRLKGSEQGALAKLPSSASLISEADASLGGVASKTFTLHAPSQSRYYITILTVKDETLFTILSTSPNVDGDANTARVASSFKFN